MFYELTIKDDSSLRKNSLYCLFFIWNVGTKFKNLCLAYFDFKIDNHVQMCAELTERNKDISVEDSRFECTQYDYLKEIRE